MSGDETLLDAFVNVSPRGLEETEQAVDQFVARIKKAFGDTSSAGVGEKLTEGIKKGLKRSVDEAREAAQKIVAGLREAVLRFGLDKDALNIRVRLLGDADIKRRLADVQSQVSAQQKEFSLAAPGEEGNEARAAAIQRINELRENELATLQQVTDELITQRGLDPVAEKEAEAFRVASQQAQNFAQELREVNQVVAKTGNIGLRDDFKVLNTDAQRLQLTLRQSLQTGDLIGTENAVAELNTLRQRFDQFRDDAERKIIIRTNAEEIAADFNAAFKQFQRQDQFDAGVSRNKFATEEDRVEFLRLKQVVGDLRDEFLRLAAATDKSADDLARMVQITRDIDDAVIGIGKLRQGVQSLGPATQVASRGLGGLGNNAYQVGQAFEDFAVGFQLDGLRGGIRGATNNVTFLINNLTQAGIAAGTLTGSMALVATLGTAAGAVIGITVLPKMIEWVQSLDDIELRSKNIAQVLEDGFRDAKFQVSLDIDARANARAVRDAESSLDAIREIIKQAEDNEDLKFKIGATINRLAEGDAVRNMQKIADDLSDVLAERLEKVSRPILIGELEEIGIDVVLIDPDQEEIRKVEDLQRAMESFNIASKQAFDNAKKGLDIEGELRTARDSLRLLTDGFEELKKSRVLGSEDSEKFLKALEAAKTIFGELTDEAQKLEDSQAANLRSAREEIEAFTRLSKEHQFMNEVNEGRLEKEDKILFDMQQQTIELEEQAKKYRQLSGDDPGIEAALAAREAALREEQRVVLVSEINDLEKQIAEEKEAAAKDAEAAAKRRLDLESRLAEQEIKGKEKVASAVFALEEEQAKQAADERQRDLQERIEALQKLDRESTSFNAGDLGTEVFNDNVKSEIERLQEELKNLKESEAEKQRQQRIIELQDRIREEREDAQKRIEDLRDDVEEARKAEIDALNENAEQIQKLIDQLRQLQAGLGNVEAGRDPLTDPALIEEQARIKAAFEQFIADPVAKAPEPVFAPEDIVPQFAPEDVVPIFAPEDIEGIGRAQADANEAAMTNMDFKSTSLEGLTQQTNRLLVTMTEGILSLDTTARLG